jgi:imidazole glycerol-phosphate synthase subunit HisF
VRRVRLIPILTIDGQKLVKTVKFKNPNYLGDPINAIKIFNEKEVDEIAVLDITASTQNKSPNFKLIEEMAGECFMPLAYGGGIKSIEDIKTLFSLGVEKIILNTTLQHNPEIITQAAGLYGSQSIVVSLDIKKSVFGNYKTCFCNGKKNGDDIPEKFAKKMESLGAGEILLNNIDKEGTFSGLDYKLINSLSKVLKIPLIACGGTNSISDILEGIKSGASAIASGSFFAYKNNDTQSILINYPSQKDLTEQLYLKLS